jgi:hypothetical protein
MHILHKISEEFWWDVARKCDYTTFYHTPIWQELAKRIFPGRYHDETFGAILHSGVRIVFPIVSKRRIGPLRWLESTPIGGYGGFIADGPVLPNEAAQIYQYARSWPTASLYVVDNPLAEPNSEGFHTHFNSVYQEDTCFLPLNTDFDTIFSHFSKTLRNAYRGGVKKGAGTRLATSIKEYYAFYTNYRDAISRWGYDESYGYSWPQWEQVYQVYQRYPKNIKLWLMLFGEQIVGGRIVFYWGRQATGWNGTAHRDFLKYDVMPVTDTNIIHDALDQGYAIFDFNTSAQKQGVKDYKMRFGATISPISGWYYENPLIASTRALYQKGRDTLASLRGIETPAKPGYQSSLTQSNAPEQNA